jgi:hypothetical protein
MKSIASIGRLVVLLLLAAGTAAAGTVTGTVLNGTNNKPASGVDVILIQLAGGMQPVANTKTDANGKYKIDNPAVGGQEPMLIRAVYRGVMFHQPLTPGNTTADVTVFEPSSDSKIVTVASRVIVFQPNNAQLVVGEEYGLENQSQPPVAYFNEKGDFNFDIPLGAQLSQVSSWGPAKMPVVQGTINRGERQYAIAYAFQPGDNGVNFSYQVPYASNQASLHFNSQYAVQRILLVAPPTVKVESAGFVAAGAEQGFNLYSRDAVPAGAMFDVSVSGTAPPPPANQDGAAGAGPDQGQDQVNGRDPGVAIQTLPNRLDSLKWILIAGFAALFALGMVFVWRRPMAVVSGGALDAPLPALPPSGPRGPRKPAATPMPSPASSINAVPAEMAPKAAAVEVEVERSLDALKDKLFRLELRHQAGTISEEDYARERGRAEQILRDLLRG